MTLYIRRLSEKAIIPKQATKDSAGFDLFSARDCIIPSKGRGIIETDIAIKLPKGTYGRIAPRSGLARDRFIDVGAGVIDRDYQGPIKVLLFNFGEDDFVVSSGSRIAQLICEKVKIPEVKESDSFDYSDDDDDDSHIGVNLLCGQRKRGSDGFGSSDAPAEKRLLK